VSKYPTKTLNGDAAEAGAIKAGTSCVSDSAVPVTSIPTIA
jgi:hypothetical protein